MELFEAHPPELRAQVVAACLVSGASKTQVAAQFGVSLASVKRWCQEAMELAAGSPRVSHQQIAQEAEWDFRAKVYDLTCALLDSASAAARATADEAWVKQQNAHDLGVYLGIVVDKAAGILAALERGAAAQRGHALESGGAGAAG